MSTETADKFRCAVLSVVKHDYVSRGVASHPRFELVVVMLFVLRESPYPPIDPEDTP